MTINSGRETLTDQKFDEDISDVAMINKLFVRAVAYKKKFKHINFSYGIFEGAYFRNCSFESCNFTGCRFINSNLVGSSFNSCNFDYATFDKTQIDNDVLDSWYTDRENLKLKFARSLRMNYQQIGDAKSVNKSMNMELAATEEHHKKAWASNDPYNRKKYTGFNRLKAFIHWLDFKLLDFVWGNGESLLKLTRTVLIVLLVLTLVDVLQSPDADSLSKYWEAFCRSPIVFLNIEKASYLSSGWLALVYFIRLVMFTFFMSIIIKRFNRR